MDGWRAGLTVHVLVVFTLADDPRQREHPSPRCPLIGTLGPAAEIGPTTSRKKPCKMRLPRPP